MPVKKTAKRTKKIEPETELAPQSPREDTVEQSGQSGFKLNKLQLILIVAALVIVGALYYFRGLFIAATVNGQPVSRFSVIQQLEKQGGKQTLDSLISKALIIQEAQKQNVTVSKAEIDAEIKKISESLEKQGQNLDQALSLQGMTKADLEEQIKIQKMLEKIVGKNVKVTDKEINEYIEKNKSLIPENMQPEEVKKTVEQQIKQQKLNEEVQIWLENLRSKAKINYLVNY